MDKVSLLVFVADKITVSLNYMERALGGDREVRVSIESGMIQGSALAKSPSV